MYLPLLDYQHEPVETCRMSAPKQCPLSHLTTVLALIAAVPETLGQDQSENGALPTAMKGDAFGD